MEYRTEYRWNGNWRMDDIPKWMPKDAAIADATTLLQDARKRRIASSPRRGSSARWGRSSGIAMRSREVANMADGWKECPTDDKRFGPHGGAQWRAARYMIRCGCDAGYCENHAKPRVYGAMLWGPKMEPGKPRLCRKHAREAAKERQRLEEAADQKWEALKQEAEAEMLAEERGE